MSQHHFIIEIELISDYRISQKLDAKNETPANFNDLLNQWSLESIACITLNRRLGLLKGDSRDENAQKLIQVR